MMNTFLSVRLPATQESPFKTGKQRSLVLWINGDENKSDAKSLLSVHEWRSAPQCYDLFLQFKHSLKLALDKIKLSFHMLQSKQAPLLVLSVTTHVEHNAHSFHSLCTNAGAAALELMHMCIHLLEVDWLLLPVKSCKQLFVFL
jgi:hypothetical protein